MLSTLSLPVMAAAAAATKRFPTPLHRSLSSVVGVRRVPEAVAAQPSPANGWWWSVATPNFPARFKGHSKWDNIQHIKKANDSKMSRVCGKYSNLIVRVVRENGGISDPKYNTALARVISDALSENVPRSTIDNAVKRASSNEAALNEILLEVRGPGNAFILVEMLGKSRGSAEQQLKSIMKKKGGMLDKGLMNTFDRRGVILSRNDGGMSFDKAEEDAIECGAEEVEKLDTEEEGNVMFRFFTDPLDFAAVKTKLEELKYEVISAGVEYVPKQLMEVSSQKEEEALNGFLEAVNGHEMVTGVFHNCS